MKRVTLAYVAGVIDGEGCIGLYCPQSTHSTQLQVKVSLTNKELVYWFYSTFGGGFRYEPARNERSKPSYRWLVGGNQALKFLKQVHPYLRLKKPQAEIAIAFQEQPFRRQGHVLLEEEKAIIETMRTQMHALNQTGV